MGYCTLRSPISGIIGLKKIDEGNIVNAKSILVNIKAIDTLYLNFTVSERDIARIEKSINAGPLLLTVYVDERTDYGLIKQKNIRANLNI